MMRDLRPAIVLLGLFSLLTGVAYPLALTGRAQAVFPVQANGSRVTRDGAVVGSALIGQSFTADRYFHGRPSATSAPIPGIPRGRWTAPTTPRARPAPISGPAPPH